MAWLAGTTILAPATLLADMVFSPTDIIEWEEKQFEGQTRYTLTEKEGREAIHAQCDSSASGLFLEKSIDLHETPYLEWEWRINQPFDGDFDETKRSGDDFALRIYAIVDGGLRPWRAKGINYVWATHQDTDQSWQNPYVNSVQMLALRSGSRDASTWQQERRNLRKDFLKLHDEKIESIDGLAIMSDCDDLQQQIEAWYGTLRLKTE